MRLTVESEVIFEKYVHVTQLGTNFKKCDHIQISFNALVASDEWEIQSKMPNEKNNTALKFLALIFFLSWTWHPKIGDLIFMIYTMHDHCKCNTPG